MHTSKQGLLQRGILSIVLSNATKRTSKYGRPASWISPPPLKQMHVLLLVKIIDV